MLWTVTRETLRGKSLYRTLSNLACVSIKLEGDGVDLGAKDGRSSYYRFLKTSSASITYCDYLSDSPDVLAFDLEKTFPIPSESEDFVLLMNVLEHLYDYENCVSEISRILKSDGTVVGCVPFLYEYHPDPSDYFRYTREALHRLFSASGFEHVEIHTLGSGPVSTGVAQFAHVFRPRMLAVILYLLSISCDKFLQWIFRGRHRVSSEAYPLGYFFFLRKST